MTSRIIAAACACACACLLAAASTATAAELAPVRQQQLAVAIGVPTEGRTLDPARASYQSTINVQNAFLAPLYVAGPNGLAPLLAVGQPVVSGGGRIITVHLRAATWSDGKPVSSTDVVTAFARARKLHNYFSSFTEGVASIATPTPRTVVFKLRKADPVFRQLLALQVFTPVPTHVIARAHERWTRAGTMVSSGPFVLKSSNSTQLVGQRNPRYWRARGVRLQTLTFTTTGDVGRTSTEARYIGRFVGAALPHTMLITQLPAAVLANSKIVRSASTEAQYMYLNTTNASLADPRVRRGIALALDRSSLRPSADDVALSTVLPSRVNGGSVVTSGAHLLEASGSADTAAASAQLAAGGWSNGTSLVLAYSKDSGLAGAMASKIRSQLATVGVTVVLKPLTGDTMSSPGFGISPVSPKIDMLLQGWVLDYSEPYDYYQLFTCANVQTGLNDSNFCDHGFDGALASLATQFDWPARLAAYRRLENRLTGPEGAMPLVPLYSPVNEALARSWVRGYAVDANGQIFWDTLAVEKH